MAVYTQVSFCDLESFLSWYGITDVVVFKGISEGVENSNYFLQTPDARFILTLFEKRVDPHDLPYFLGLMGHLHQKGIVCPQPLVAKDGLVLRDLCNRKACLTTFLDGKSVQKIRPEHCEELGRMLARIHLAASDYAGYRSNALSVKGWEELLSKIAERANTVAAGLYEEISQTLYEIKKNFPTDLPKGVIHADLFPDNVFFEQDKLSGVIDFYFACNDFFAYELAICLNAWCFDTNNGWRFNQKKAECLWKGYQSIRPLTDREKQFLPVLAQGSALRFLLTRTYDWLNPRPDATVVPKDPLEYLEKLRFHKSIKCSADYGL